MAKRVLSDDDKRNTARTERQFATHVRAQIRPIRRSQVGECALPKSAQGRHIAREKGTKLPRGGCRLGQLLPTSSRTANNDHGKFHVEHDEANGKPSTKSSEPPGESPRDISTISIRSRRGRWMETHTPADEENILLAIISGTWRPSGDAIVRVTQIITNYFRAFRSVRIEIDTFERICIVHLLN